MNQEDFKHSPSGRLMPTVQNCFAFIPHPLPPHDLPIGDLVGLIASAEHALGELSGIGRSIPNPYLLIRPFMRVEAVASSKIEGTVTSLSELFMLEAGIANARSDTREVNNYNNALQHGLDRVEELPVSKRLIRELHSVLMDGVGPSRGAQFTPGEFRADQNWIGARLIQNAKFVPPTASEAMTALDDLEKYIHAKDDLPLIVRLALIHYQFETIHPFPDGNGRVGRLLIPLLLCERKQLSQPLLYLSAFFEKHYNTYVDSLFEVSRSGAWGKWIEFFLRGVEESCRDAIKKAHALQDLHREYHERIRKARSSALLARIVDKLFEIPVANVPFVMRQLHISYNSAKNNIQRLVDARILAIDPKKERPQWFLASEIMMIAYREEAIERREGETELRATNNELPVLPADKEET